MTRVGMYLARFSNWWTIEKKTRDEGKIFLICARTCTWSSIPDHPLRIYSQLVGCVFVTYLRMNNRASSEIYESSDQDLWLSRWQTDEYFVIVAFEDDGSHNSCEINSSFSEEDHLQIYIITKCTPQRIITHQAKVWIDVPCIKYIDPTEYIQRLWNTYTSNSDFIVCRKRMCCMMQMETMQKLTRRANTELTK